MFAAYLVVEFSVAFAFAQFFTNTGRLTQETQAFMFGLFIVSLLLLRLVFTVVFGTRAYRLMKTMGQSLPWMPIVVLILVMFLGVAIFHGRIHRDLKARGLTMGLFWAKAID